MFEEELVWHHILSRDGGHFKEIMVAYFEFEREETLRESMETIAETLLASELPRQYQVYPFSFNGHFFCAVALPDNRPEIMREIAERIKANKIQSPNPQISKWVFDKYQEFLRTQQKGIVLLSLGGFEAKICLN